MILNDAGKDSTASASAVRDTKLRAAAAIFWRDNSHGVPPSADVCSVVF